MRAHAMSPRFDPKNFPHVLGLREGERVEFKAAQGRDGNGAVPEALWETYVAFGNTRGGVIILGVEERGELLELVGVRQPERVMQELWEKAHDPRVVNVNLLTPHDIFTIEQEGVALVVMRVPSASPEQRPVYKGSDPQHGAYVRISESDYLVESRVAERAFHIAHNDALRDGLLERRATRVDPKATTSEE